MMIFHYSGLIAYIFMLSVLSTSNLDGKRPKCYKNDFKQVFLKIENKKFVSIIKSFSLGSSYTTVEKGSIEPTGGGKATLDIDIIAYFTGTRKTSEISGYYVKKIKIENDGMRLFMPSDTFLKKCSCQKRAFRKFGSLE